MTIVSISRWMPSLALALASLASGAVMAASAFAPLSVNLAGSTLSFNTTKAGAAGVGGVTETMQFKRYEGGINAQGEIMLKIDLSSVDSGIDIRNERMQNLLWNVGQFPSVTFSGRVKPEMLPQKPQESVALEVEGQLTMAGQSKLIKTQLRVTALEGKWWVSTRTPIVVKADDFGLTSGVEALRAIMGLNYLSSSAPVNFQLEMVPAVVHVEAKSKPAAVTLPSSAW